ncbi:CAP domain-containing protein [Saliterribacillus persicus]|uniref:Spore coat assembly protein SafA/uncharacterized YkwD family protein n=1 Tax=Saliterribacillus persicus TaxID=930114 RepID=A0A368XAE9_9BACI|nr:CAP domain-containing protein [Saliterribacillus persicus]RCW64825.1 spore coat assembly protein SafA/uncharacterized YkwD family protein [Saliterribacillus persicus]
MKKISLLVLIGIFIMGANVVAAEEYEVIKHDTLWKISKKYRIGLSEIIEANPQIENPDLIYPEQIITIPDKNQLKNVELQTIELTNEERIKYGLNPLKVDWQLARVAKYKSRDMKDNGYFSHQSPTYGSPFDMMRSFNVSYSAAAENIAKGQRTAEEVVRAWMNSEGHRKNILSEKYTHIGVGLVKEGNYWTQMFIAK